MEEGRADIIAALFPLVEDWDKFEKYKEIDVIKKNFIFSKPYYAAKEIVVTNNYFTKIKSIDDLVDKKARIHQKSLYFLHLENIGHKQFNFINKNIPILSIIHDLVECKKECKDQFTIVDSNIGYLAKKIFGKKINIFPFSDKKINYGWALNIDATELKDLVDRFFDSFKKGTLQGNILINKYFKSKKNYLEQMKTVLGKINQKQMIISKYDKKIQTINKKIIQALKIPDDKRFDWKLISALIRKESNFNHKVGINAWKAIGLFQIKAIAACEIGKHLKGFEKCKNLKEGEEKKTMLKKISTKLKDSEQFNIRSGILYLYHLQRNIFSKKALNKTFCEVKKYEEGFKKHCKNKVFDKLRNRDEVRFILSGYNGGHQRTYEGIKYAAKTTDLNPSKWFNNVEMGVREENINYVSDIMKYYLLYIEYLELLTKTHLL